jgi:hypothetical protein
MKLDSKECREALETYQAKSKMEKLAVKVLLTADEDVANIPGITDLNSTEIDLLTGEIVKIRKHIGIEEA